MSRRFELFERLDRECSLTPNPAAGNPRSGGRRPILALDSSWREELERLVTRLYMLPNSPAPRMLVFLGMGSGNVSSWVCAHTSDLLASRISGSVCLIEANPDMPSLGKRLGLAPRQGLVDLLAEGSLDLTQAVAQTPEGNLWLLSYGSAARGQGSVLRSERIADLLPQVRACFDFILIDAPPVGVSRDALVLAQLGGGVVLVLQAGSTHREAARRLKEELEESGVPILGAILANCASSIPDTIERHL
jgi:hypothetical protein